MAEDIIGAGIDVVETAAHRLHKRFISNPLEQGAVDSDGASNSTDGADRLEAACFDVDSTTDTKVTENMAGSGSAVYSHVDLRKLRYHGDGLSYLVNFIVRVLVFTSIPFLIPVGGACSESDRTPAGQWPSKNWMWFINAWFACNTMFLCIPLLLFVLVGMHIQTDPDGTKTVEHSKEERQLLQESAKISIIFATIVMTLETFHTRFTFGWPVPFAHLISGFPGQGVSMLLMAWYLVKAKGIPTEIVWRGTVLHASFFVLIFAVSVGYPLLVALMRRYPEWYYLWSAGFPGMKWGSMKLLAFAFRGEEFDRAIPFAAVVLVNAAINQAINLPGAVTFGTYCILMLLDIVGILMHLHKLWRPVMQAELNTRRKLKAQTKVDQDAVDRESGWMRMRTNMQVVKDRHAELHDMHARATQAVQARANEHSRPASAQTALEDAQTVAEHQVSSDSTKPNSESKFRTSEDRQELPMQYVEDVKAQHELPMLSIEDVKAQHRTNLRHYEMMIVYVLMDEFAEIFCPLLITLIETILYFSTTWNPNYLPQLTMDLQNDFFYSTAVKLLFTGCQVLSAWVAIFVIDRCTVFDSRTVATWMLKHYFDLSWTVPACVATFLYMTMSPHYRFDVARALGLSDDPFPRGCIQFDGSGDE